MRSIAGVVCRQWGLELVAVDFPEDWKPTPKRPLDGLVITTGPAIAVEHTLYLSYPGQIQDGVRVMQKLGDLIERVSGTLPAPGQYNLGVAINAVAGHGKTDLAPLEAWIRAVAPTLTLGRGFRGPTHIACGQPPVVPFAVDLSRWEKFEDQADGALSLRRPIDLEKLPSMNLEQTRIAVAKKLPKLEEHRPANGRTLLIFEEPGIELVNTDSATKSIRAALDERPDLPRPDAVVLAYTVGPCAMWIKDGSRWHPDLENRGVIRL